MAATSVRAVLTTALTRCTETPTPPQGSVASFVEMTPATVSTPANVEMKLVVRNNTEREVTFTAVEWAVLRVGRSTVLLNGEVEAEGLLETIRLAPGEQIIESAGELPVDGSFLAGQYEVHIRLEGLSSDARGVFRVQ